MARLVAVIVACVAMQMLPNPLPFIVCGLLLVALIAGYPARRTHRERKPR